MKLIYFVQYFPPEKASGLQLVEDLLEGFANAGWEIELFTPMPTRGISSHERNEYKYKRVEKRYNGKLTIHRMHLFREGKGIIGRAIRYLLFSVECFWKAVTVPADFIFTGSGPPTQGMVVGLAKKLSKKKRVIYNLQDIFPDSLVTSGICSENSKIMKIGRMIENYTYRNADVIITITDDMKTNIVNKGVNPEKVAVVRNWINTNEIIPIDRNENKLIDELRLNREEFYVVYAGNLGKVQGVEVIIHAADMLKDQTDIRFLIFGNGSEEDRLKHLCQGRANISFYPLQAENRISEVYSLGNVSVIPCKPGTGGSGMPSKTWTIMATGTPIIASFDLGGEMEKTINEANCGFCIEAGDAEKLSETILLMKKNPMSNRIMGINARRYAEIFVTKEQAVRKYIDIIERVSTMQIK